MSFRPKFHQVVRASTPFFTIIFSVFLLGKRCTRQKVFSLVPVVAGVGFAWVFFDFHEGIIILLMTYLPQNIWGLLLHTDWIFPHIARNITRGLEDNSHKCHPGQAFGVRSSRLFGKYSSDIEDIPTLCSLVVVEFNNQSYCPSISLGFTSVSDQTLAKFVARSFFLHSQDLSRTHTTPVPPLPSRIHPDDFPRPFYRRTETRSFPPF